LLAYIALNDGSQWVKGYENAHLEEYILVFFVGLYFHLFCKLNNRLKMRINLLALWLITSRHNTAARQLLMMLN
jgi:hypothetical protein